MSDLPPRTGEPDAPLSQPDPSFPARVTPAAGPAPKNKPHVLAIVALCAAALGLIFACIPGALIVGWILLPIGFVLSLVALFLKGAKWPAITGVIVAVVGTVIGFIVFFALVANAAGNALADTGPRSDSGSGTATSNAPEPAASAGAAVADSDYGVTIDGLTLTTDYEGKPAIIVDSTFTNNSNKDANFMFAVSAKAFQGGVELADAMLLDDSVDPSATLSDIKPGVSIPLKRAYVLADQSDVLVEVAELISFDDALIATKTFSVQ